MLLLTYETPLSRSIALSSKAQLILYCKTKHICISIMASTKCAQWACPLGGQLVHAWNTAISCKKLSWHSWYLYYKFLALLPKRAFLVFTRKHCDVTSLCHPCVKTHFLIFMVYKECEHLERCQGLDVNTLGHSRLPAGLLEIWRGWTLPPTELQLSEGVFSKDQDPQKLFKDSIMNVLDSYSLELSPTESLDGQGSHLVEPEQFYIEE